MSTTKGNQAHLTESQKQSAYFAMINGETYNKDFYENDCRNVVKIFFAFLIFYSFNALHFWANFELGLADPVGSTVYNLIMFGVTVFVIGMMLFFGAKVNKLKLAHEFYSEKISEEKQKQHEAQAKAAAKAHN